MRAERKIASAKKNKLCIHSRCKHTAVTAGYCRLHYIVNWKHIKFDRQVKAERKLNAYVDRLVKKYPKDYIEKIKEGLENEKKFKETMEDLELEVEPDADAPETDKEFLERLARNLKIE